MPVTLQQLIRALRAADPALVVRYGFGSPMSFRADYEQLAFDPRENVTVAEMLAFAEEALGSTFEGYKGGDFTMHGYTYVWIAEYGSATGDGIGPTLLAFMLGTTPEEMREIHYEPQSTSRPA